MVCDRNLHLNPWKKYKIYIFRQIQFREYFRIFFYHFREKFGKQKISPNQLFVKLNGYSIQNFLYVQIQFHLSEIQFRKAFETGVSTKFIFRQEFYPTFVNQLWTWILLLSWEKSKLYRLLNEEPNMTCKWWMKPTKSSQ